MFNVGFLFVERLLEPDQLPNHLQFTLWCLSVLQDFPDRFQLILLAFFPMVDG